MIYAEVDQLKNIIRYPANPIQENPSTAFRNEWPGGEVDGVYYETVEITSIPTFDPETQKISESTPERNEEDKLIQSWTITDLTTEELEEKLLNKRSKMVCSRFQALAALYGAGLLTSIESIINNPESDPMLKLAWDNALEFRRLSPMLITLTSTMGLTDEQLDNLFIQALSIEV